jgi:hypothetical protein
LLSIIQGRLGSPFKREMLKLHPGRILDAICHKFNDVTGRVQRSTFTLDNDDDEYSTDPHATFTTIPTDGDSIF